MVSAIFLMFIGFFLLLNKRFSKHPYPLIAAAMLLNAAYFCALYSNFLICKFHMYKYSIQIIPKLWNDRYFVDFDEIFQHMVVSWKLITIVTSVLDITINSLIFLDLDLTITNPFYPRSKRVKYYIAIVFFVLLYFTYIFVLSYNGNGTNL